MARAPKPAATPSASKPAAKGAGAEKAAARKAAAATAAEGPVLRKKELVDLVAAASSLAKKDVKATVDAVLHLLGETLGAGREMNLPPLGKARVSKQKDHASGATLTIKLRRNTARQPGAAAANKAAKEALAEQED